MTSEDKSTWLLAGGIGVVLLAAYAYGSMKEARAAGSAPAPAGSSVRPYPGTRKGTLGNGFAVVSNDGTYYATYFTVLDEQGQVRNQWAAGDIVLPTATARVIYLRDPITTPGTQRLADPAQAYVITAKIAEYIRNTPSAMDITG